MSKINMISCGGCGANVALSIVEKMKKIPTSKEFPEISYIHMDTSVANKDISSQYNAEFFHIKSNSVGDEGKLSGSGALRSKNVSDTLLGINELLNTNKDILKDDTLNVLVASASGGSGSIISPLLSKVLIEKDIPFIVLLVGDDSNLTYATNTNDTLKTFHSIAVAKDVTIPMFYINNSEMDNDLKKVNSHLAGFIISLSMFYISNNKDIDFADMSTFLRIDKMRPKLNIPSGVCLLDAVSGDDTKNIDTENLIAARVLNSTLSTGALNEKHGSIIYNELITFLEKGKNLPIIIYSRTGQIEHVIDNLEMKISRLDVKMKADKIDTSADDNGLVL